MYEKIKNLAHERNWSLSKLSAESHVPLQTIYNLKARQDKDGSLSAKNAVRIARSLGITVEELVSGTDYDSK